ncbi:2-dehydropantoate 2-reductase [Bacillus sp. 1P06AnD]|uniref:2-dehydropantoate 2-reductase n=1 Tax=Bacillus sp. 1P06AnD TaxID=3132208 RepID=UPI0039A13EB3
MKIGIIGGGSIGLLTGTYLSNNHEVTIYTRSKLQADVLNKDGLILKKSGHAYQIACKASQFPNQSVNQEDLLIVTVKQYQLAGIMDDLKKLDTRFLFLQNGMGHLEACEMLAKRNDVYVGVVEHGALRDGHNSVIHTGLGVLKVAAVSGDLASLSPLAGVPDFPFIMEADYTSMLLDKLCVNATINPLTAVLGAANGELLDNPYYYEAFLVLFNEISDVLGIKDAEIKRLHIESICRKTQANISSMRKDVEEGRPTEVDAILGYILHKAQEKNCAAPIINYLYCLIKGIERRRKEN